MTRSRVGRLPSTQDLDCIHRSMACQSSGVFSRQGPTHVRREAPSPGCLVGVVNQAGSHVVGRSSCVGILGFGLPLHLNHLMHGCVRVGSAGLLAGAVEFPPGSRPKRPQAEEASSRLPRPQGLALRGRWTVVRSRRARGNARGCGRRAQGGVWFLSPL